MSPKEIVRLMNEEERFVLLALQSAENEIADCIQKAADSFVSGGRIVYVGAGTSGRIATMDAAEMPPTFGIESDKFLAIVAGGQEAGTKAIEDAEDEEHLAIKEINKLKLGKNDIIIGLAASGKTPFVIAALRHAQQKGIWTCGISNNPHPPMFDYCNLPIFLDTGAEVLTGSTRLKAGTAQKLILNRISTGAMVLAGKVIENLMVDVKAKNAKLKERCIVIVRELTLATAEEARDMLEKNDWNVRKVLESLSMIV